MRATRRATASGGGHGAAGIDPEELRYAPRPPKRFLWLRRLALLVVVLGLIGGGARFAYSWTQKQYYVGTDGDYVAIFKGVDAGDPRVSPCRRCTRSRSCRSTSCRRTAGSRSRATSRPTTWPPRGRSSASCSATAEECAAKATPKPTANADAEAEYAAGQCHAGLEAADDHAGLDAGLDAGVTPGNGTVNPDDCDGVR